MTPHFQFKFFGGVLSMSLILLSALSFGQGVLNDNAKISVSSGTFFIIDNGGFTNNGASGQVANAGTITVDGTWTNNSTTNVFGATPTLSTGGMVLLDGGPQNIRGLEPTHFYDLTAGGAGFGDSKTLLAVDADVFGQVTLTTGILLNSQTLTLHNTLPAAIAGSGVLVAETPPASGYGMLSWNIGNLTGNYTVPFGTLTGVSIPVNYNIASAGTGSTADAFKNFSTYPTAVTNVPVAATVTRVTDDFGNDNSSKVFDRFWIIDNDAQGNYATYPNISMTMNYLDAELSGTITEANLVAQRFNNNPGENRWGDWLYSPVANTAGNTVTVNLTRVEDYFPVWTLVDNSDPLPIEIARFVGQCDDNGILVGWTTYSETDNDLFTLERSKNGVDFEEVEVVAGAGNSNQPINYQVLDENAFGGTSYYRLRSTDVYGKQDYSPVIAVTCGEESTDFTYVNAYEIDNTDLQIEFTASNNEPYTVTLYDASGRIILNHNSKAAEGMNRLRLPVGNVAKGIYIVNLQNSSKRFSKKVMLN